MFSKNKPHEGQDAPTATTTTAKPSTPPGSPPASAPSSGPSTGASTAPAQSKPKAQPSVLSSDLVVTGHLKTAGDIQIEGSVEGDIHAHLLTVGENATVKGEVVADDVVVTGRVVGRVRGLKVRLTATARVEGDIVHKTIAIESGAHFEGSVQRNDDPLKNDGQKKPLPSANNGG
ncbi:polymer-forming cytoskeletal protein [Rhodobacteraceae bacterium 2CG4]|uniref:Polymer-forming cytoskeletal protein n=1 Tax=Halovulum marinum TaxID=2662447 RepID=A0A6L5YYW8_9RHOB|nr:polymer-forming cytoskeletal protein [Halovulum marinum]MSU89072.1 polymer-forming cytoskeletal protein [Halovulum marinum]